MDKMNEKNKFLGNFFKLDALGRKGFLQVRNNMVAPTMFLPRRNSPEDKIKCLEEQNGQNGNSNHFASPMEQLLEDQLFEKQLPKCLRRKYKGYILSKSNVFIPLKNSQNTDIKK
jgi:hypothetical protein